MLRSHTVLSRLVLEAEMRHILKIPDPHLDEDQVKVLDMAREKKDLLLWGGYGTGKTVLGCEAAKIKIAKLLKPDCWRRGSERRTSSFMYTLRMHQSWTLRVKVISLVILGQSLKT